MSAREEVLANIRRSLGVTGKETIRRQIAFERLERAPKGTIPARGQVAGAERLALFRRQAEGSLATVAEVASAADVPESVAAFLRNHNLPAAIRIGEDPRLAAMPWQDTVIEVSQGRSNGGDTNAVSYAFGGVAETGTIAMVSGPDNPSTLNFLADNHVVVVSEKDLIGDYETLWSKIRFAYGKGRHAADRQLDHRPVPVG